MGSPVDVAVAFAEVKPGMTDREVAERLGPPAERVESRQFARDSALWSLRDTYPEPVRVWSNDMTDAELSRTVAPGDTTYSRTDTWEVWDGSPPTPHMQTWLVFYEKKAGGWRVTLTEDRSSGIVF